MSQQKSIPKSHPLPKDGFKNIPMRKVQYVHHFYFLCSALNCLALKFLIGSELMAVESQHGPRGGRLAKASSWSVHTFTSDDDDDMFIVKTIKTKTTNFGCLESMNIAD